MNKDKLHKATTTTRYRVYELIDRLDTQLYSIMDQSGRSTGYHIRTQEGKVEVVTDWGYGIMSLGD